MSVDEIITLEDGKEYILLLESVVDNANYFLGVEAINNEPSDHYEVFKQVFENNEYSVEEVTDKDLLDRLLADFEEKFDIENLEGE